MITPARRSTLHEVISSEIIELIYKGDWKPGDRIPGELSLSEQFEVSRNSIRESVKALELVGLLKSSPGKGTFVSEHALDRIRQIRYNTALDEFDPEGFLVELLETRLVTEPGLCWLAANYADKKALSKMEKIIDKSLDAVDHNEYHFDLGMAFHEELYLSSGNNTLINLFVSMKERYAIARREVYFKLSKKETLVNELSEHREILNLIKNKEGIKAANEMRKHLHAPLQRVRSHMKRKKSSN
jgi:GntR family transcriptional regulator, transcriptional repressor for pyruvate dehydrogenase complex